MKVNIGFSSFISRFEAFDILDLDFYILDLDFYNGACAWRLLSPNYDKNQIQDTFILFFSHSVSHIITFLEHHPLQLYLKNSSNKE